MKLFKNKTLIVALLCVVLTAVLLLTAQAQSTMDEKGKNSGIYTDSILEKANITLGENDRVLREDTEGCVALNVVRAFNVEVDYCGVSCTAEGSGGTVKEALESLGITLTGDEDITPPADSPVTADTKIVVKGDFLITLTLMGEVAEYEVNGGTDEQFLESIDVKLTKDDLVTPKKDTVIDKDTEITVKIVEYKEETATEPVDYGFVTEKTSSLASGTSKIKQYGIEGEKTIVSKNKYVDGKLVSSEVISEEITREPVDQIKLVGTGSSSSGSNNSSSNNSGSSSSNSSAGSSGYFYDQSGNKVYYKKKLTGSSTAYYAEPGALTATGVPAYFGGVAVNPNVIPYGSKLYIVSTDGYVYGYATAVDTGGALMSGYVLVDVYYPTYNQCMNWGRRNAIVYVL